MNMNSSLQITGRSSHCSLELLGEFCSQLVRCFIWSGIVGDCEYFSNISFEIHNWSPDCPLLFLRGVLSPVTTRPESTWGLCPGSSPSEWLREDEHWDFDHYFGWIQWTSGNFWMICWDVIQQQVGTDCKHVVLKPWRVNHGAHDHGMRIPEIQVLRQFWRPPCDRGGWQLDFGDVGFSYVGTIFWNQQRRGKNNDVKVYKGSKVQNIIWSKSLSLVPWPSLQCHQRVTVSISRWS